MMKVFLFCILLAIGVCVTNYSIAQAPTITSFSPTTAGPDDTVTITGTNFVNVEEVQLGGYIVNYQVISSTEILAFEAAGATSGDVIVTTSSGIASLPGFTWNGYPVITSVSPDTASAGQTVIITGKYIAAGAFPTTQAVSFGGVPATSITPLSFTQVKAVVGNGASGQVSLTALYGTATYPNFVFKAQCSTVYDTVNTSICHSQLPYTWNGKSYSSPGFYMDTLTSTGGCDSIAILDLKVFFPGSSITNVAVCSSNLPYIWNGKSYSATGTYADTIRQIVGCDSIATLNLTAGTSSTSTTNLTICASQLPYFWGGLYIYSQGTYNDTLRNYAGCDSIATLNLTVNQPPTTPTGINSSRQCYGTVTLGVTVSSGVIDTAIRWYSDIDLTTQVGIGSSFTTPPINTTTNYYVIERNAAECATPPVTVTATVNSGVSTPPVDTIINYLQNATASALTATVSPGDTLLWYTVALGGTGSLTAPIPSTAIIGSTIYYVSQKGILCESPRVAIKVIVSGVTPTIISFSPASGPVGTTVTITGTNFSATPANNIVYFGAVRATVTNANATTLTVTVPVSATYLPISVTINGLTAYAVKPFIVTFAGAQAIFTPNSFASKIDSATGNTPLASSIADIDGDGKPDIVIINDSDNSVSVYRNTSKGNIISFAPRVNFPTGAFPYAVSTGDVDGDGKLDIMVANSVDSTVSVYRNTSVAGTISFAARVNYKTGVNPRSVTTGDLDGDGRPDLAVGNYGDTTVWIYHNIGGIGLIAFDTAIKLNAKVGKPSHADLYSFSIVDVDGDGKPDIAAETASYGYLSIFRNTSSVGIISFAPRIDVLTQTQSKAIYVGDIDGDGKPDAIVANTQDTSISVFRNISTPGSVAFAAAVNYSAGSLPRGIGMNDLDGDGKPDVVVANSGTNTVSVFKNISTSGTISLAARVNYTVGTGPHDVSIVDLDGDGKPDIITPNQYSYTVSILRNQIGEAVRVPICPPVGNSVLVSYLPGTTYQWQVNTGTGFTNISDNSNYFGSNTDSLQVNNIPSSWYGYQYRCVVNGNNDNVYTLKFADTWIGAISSAWANPSNWSCDQVPDSNTDVIINSGTVVLSSNTSVRSLTVNPGVSFTIVAPYNITVAH